LKIYQHSRWLESVVNLLEQV